MKIHFTNYANSKFRDKQNKLNEYAYNSKQFDLITAWSPDCINQQFYAENKEILEKSRGGGYWLWKPHFIFNTMLKRMDEGDALLYLDSGDVFFGEIGNLIRNVMNFHDILLTTGHNQQKKYCKRDAFYFMGCDSEEYWNNMQIEAGMIIIKNNQRMRNLVWEWLQFCRNPNILTDIPNTCGKDNFPEFIDHRHDQAVLNNLKVKYNLPESDIIRGYTQGNYDPKIHTHIRF